MLYLYMGNAFQGSMRVVWFVLGILAIVMIPIVFGATIHGTVYDFGLDKLPESIVEINTIPKQVFVAKNGTYSFTVPPGSYVLYARHNGFDLEIKENITAQTEGDYVLDLILLPSIEAEEELLLEEDLDISVIESVVEEARFPWLPWILLFALLIFIAWRLSRKKVEKFVVKKVALSEELQKILDFIDKEGGRTTQKDIRKNFPYSEAKISLMIDELQAKGFVKKIKKGRGNVILKS